MLLAHKRLDLTPAEQETYPERCSSAWWMNALRPAFGHMLTKSDTVSYVGKLEHNRAVIH